MTTPVTPDEKPKRGWLIAVAAAAVVILVVGAVLLLDRSDDGVAPATTPSTTLGATPTTSAAAEPTPTTTAGVVDAPTTTAFAPPELDEQAAAYVHAMVDELNAGDHEAAAARILEVPTFETSAGGFVSDDRNQVAGRYAIWTLVDSVLEVVECRTLGSGMTRCEVARTSPLDFSSPDPEISVFLVRLDDDGELQYMRQDPGAGGAWNIRYQLFAGWVQENHAEVTSRIFSDFSNPEESAELLVDYYARWIEESGGA